MHEIWIKKLTEELTKPLPGVEAQLRLSPSVRRQDVQDRKLSKSAVMVVLYPDGSKIHTLFIKRSEYDGVHSGQVSFPGGMHKNTDFRLRNTALRETWEEVGIPKKDIRIIGKLTSLNIPVSNTQVHPYVGICLKKPFLRPDPLEVKYIIECPIEDLMAPENRKQKIMAIGEQEIEIPYFDILGDHIWGATAMITSEFLEIVSRLE